jgi:hypothetical protein
MLYKILKKKPFSQQQARKNMCILLAHEIFAIEVMQCILGILDCQSQLLAQAFKSKTYSGILELDKPKA